jgi:hypothetical protein
MNQGEALQILQSGAHVFLTGEPGSGKTHTINRYVQWLRARGIEPAITASTGIAATHIGGYTIHAWCGIGVRLDWNEGQLARLRHDERLFRRVSTAKVLIIDEISMLSAARLSAVDAACRALRMSGEPFGGLQVILVGDFFQLPPVRRQPEPATLELFPQPHDAGHFAYDSPSWDALDPTICYLTEQHRQEDPVFLELLGAIRSSDVRDDHRELLAARRFDNWSEDFPRERVTQLYSHNTAVDVMNTTALEKLPGPVHEFTAEHEGVQVLVEQIERGCLSPRVLSLKKGARVMFTKNSFLDGFVNGTTGTVIDFDELSDGLPVVKTTRGKEILVEPSEWRIDNNEQLLACITQIPLRLAWAITVHKSQGMSLDAAHIDLTRAFEYGQGYVALSRLRTLAGLSLAGFNERALRVDPEIAERDRDLRRQSRATRSALSADPTSFHDDALRFVERCGGREPKR